MTNRLLVAMILLIGTATFLVRIPFPIGTNVFNFQLCWFPQYIVLFIIGVLAYRGDWLSKLDVKMGMKWLLVSVVSFPLVFLPAAVVGGAISGNLDAFLGGVTWQSAFYALWEELFGIGMCVFLLVRFREKRNVQSRWDKVMAENSFGIYLFHAPVLVAIAFLMSALIIPTFFKFAILLSAGLVMTLILSIALHRVPVLRSVI